MDSFYILIVQAEQYILIVTSFRNERNDIFENDLKQFGKDLESFNIHLDDQLKTIDKI